MQRPFEAVGNCSEQMKECRQQMQSRIDHGLFANCGDDELALEMHEPKEVALWRAANEVHKIDCDDTFHLSLRLFCKRSS